MRVEGLSVENLLTFVLAVLAILVMPGPTNTLLATAGATVGWTKSLTLIPAELSAYVISITTIAAVAAPLLANSPGATIALKFACALYLVYVAWLLWRTKSMLHASAIGFWRVFVTTLLNPKALVFALAIFPNWRPSTLNFFFPHMTTFAIICGGVACCWIAAGSLLRARTAAYLGAHAFVRACSIALGCFAFLLLSSIMVGSNVHY
jgi:threonine/homoserine/homoserine lactone efflux protein